MRDLLFRAKYLFVAALVTTDGRQELRRRLICCLVVQLDGMRRLGCQSGPAVGGDESRIVARSRNVS